MYRPEILPCNTWQKVATTVGYDFRGRLWMNRSITVPSGHFPIAQASRPEFLVELKMK